MRARVLLALTFLVLTGCSKSEEAGAPSGNTTTTPPVLPPTPPGPPTPKDNTSKYNWTNGATIEVDINVSTLSDFLGAEAAGLRFNGSVVRAKLNVALGPQGMWQNRKVYWGHIRLAFESLGPDGTGTVYVEKRFSTAHVNSLFASSLEKNQFNTYYVINGVESFKVFAQDPFRSIHIVTDSMDDSGRLSGKLYYYKFISKTTQGPEYSDSCWMIRVGPFDCRDYLTGRDEDGDRTNRQYDMEMNPGQSLYPDRQKIDSSGRNLGQVYFQLTEFQGLDGTKALNN